MRMLLTALALLAVGCSSSPSALLGTWTVASGSISTICGTQITQTPITGKVIIVAGSDSSSLAVSTPENCSETYSVDGDVANLTTTPEICPITSNNETATLTFTADKLSLTGTVLTETGSGTETASTSGTGSCTFTQDFTATKTSD